MRGAAHYRRFAAEERRVYIDRAAENVRVRRALAKSRGLCMCGEPVRVGEDGKPRLDCEACFKVASFKERVRRERDVGLKEEAGE
jgi:hypothetical protein